jgi:hypothetical protein
VKASQVVLQQSEVTAKEIIMPEEEGALRMLPSGRWAILRPGRDPMEITSGEIFRLEVDGELRLATMEHLPVRGYYVAEGYELREGMRAAVVAER